MGKIISISNKVEMGGLVFLKSDKIVQTIKMTILPLLKQVIRDFFY
jgi:hypothetical protein